MPKEGKLRSTLNKSAVIGESKTASNRRLNYIEGVEPMDPNIKTSIVNKIKKNKFITAKDIQEIEKLEAQR